MEAEVPKPPLTQHRTTRTGDPDGERKCCYVRGNVHVTLYRSLTQDGPMPQPLIPPAELTSGAGGENFLPGGGSPLIV